MSSMTCIYVTETAHAEQGRSREAARHAEGIRRAQRSRRSGRVDAHPRPRRLSRDDARHTPYRGGDPYYSLRVWAFRDGRWQLANTQQTVIRSTPGSPRRKCSRYRADRPDSRKLLICDGSSRGYRPGSALCAPSRAPVRVGAAAGGQDNGRRTMVAMRLPTTNRYPLDGRLDEPVWQRATPAADFVQIDPANGSAADRTHRSAHRLRQQRASTSA